LKKHISPHWWKASQVWQLWKNIYWVY